MKKLYSFVATAFLLCAVPSLAADEAVAVSATPSVSAEMTLSEPVSVDAPAMQNEEKIPPVEMRGNENSPTENRAFGGQDGNARSEMGGRNRGERGEMNPSFQKFSRDGGNFERHDGGFWGAFWTGFLSLIVGAGVGIGGTVWFLRRKAMGK